VPQCTQLGEPEKYLWAQDPACAGAPT